MVERRNGASLLRETRSMLASEPFYGIDSIQPEIAGLPYFAHASLADELKNSIGTELFARCKWHVWIQFNQKDDCTGHSHEGFQLTTQARIRVLGVEDTHRIVYSYRAVGMREP